MLVGGDDHLHLGGALLRGARPLDTRHWRGVRVHNAGLLVPQPQQVVADMRLAARLSLRMDVNSRHPPGVHGYRRPHVQPLSHSTAISGLRGDTRECAQDNIRLHHW